MLRHQVQVPWSTKLKTHDIIRNGKESSGDDPTFASVTYIVYMQYRMHNAINETNEKEKKKNNVCSACLSYKQVKHVRCCPAMDARYNPTGQEIDSILKWRW